MFAHFEYEYVTYEELYQAYLDCRKRKKRTYNAFKFDYNASENLYNLWVELNKKTYKIGRSIAFIVNRPVKREVFAADFRDRIVHHLVINRINKFFEGEFIQDSYSCREGKGTEYAVQRCKFHIKECSENYTKDAFIFKGDLRSFFMTINKKILYTKLCLFIKEKSGFSEKDYRFLCWLLDIIIFNEPQKNCILKQDRRNWNGLPKNKSLFFCDTYHGLPIGNLTSQLFANFYLSWFDHWVNDYLGFHHYGRYVDDFYIVSQDKDKLLKSINLIKKKLKDNGITLHPNKIYLQHYSKGVKFVGSIIKQDRVYIAKRTISNFWFALKNINFDLKTYPIDNDIINHCVCVINSYLGFMSHKNTFNVKKKIFKWDYLSIIREYCYFDENLTKAMPFKEFSYDLTKDKHLSKQIYYINR